MTNLDAFYLRNLSLVLSIPYGACTFFNTKIMSEFHGNYRKCSAIVGSRCPLGCWSFLDNSAIMCRMRASQLDCAMSLVSPWPSINFVGLISKSYSSRTAIHFPFLPSGSGWVRISFTDGVDMGNNVRVRDVHSELLQGLH